MLLLQEQLLISRLLPGGVALNTSLLNENFIDEMYLDIEPVVFARGVLSCFLARSAIQN